MLLVVFVFVLFSSVFLSHPTKIQQTVVEVEQVQGLSLYGDLVCREVKVQDCSE